MYIHRGIPPLPLYPSTHTHTHTHVHTVQYSTHTVQYTQVYYLTQSPKGAYRGGQHETVLANPLA